jgi:hypothetical protein
MSFGKRLLELRNLKTILVRKHQKATAETKENITMERSEFEFRLGREFSLLHVVQTRSGAHRTSFLMGTGVCFPGSKVEKHEADLSLPTSAEVKKTWICTFHSPICLNGIMFN